MCEMDLETVLQIESASFSRPWTRSHFLDELQSPFGFPLVAQTPEGCVAGYLCLKILLDEAEILDVAVECSQRGRGVGQTLVHAGFELCRATQVRLVFLEVRVGNQAAIGLYSRLGFRESGRRKHYYENGEDALLMEYTLDNR
jgi:[ribosomal protein S18]-alanine N-acetyltransferase